VLCSVTGSRVDVGAQANGTARVAVLEDCRTTPVLPSPRCTGMPQAVSVRAMQVRGPLLLKPKLGMGMNVPPQGLNGSRIGQDRLE